MYFSHVLLKNLRKVKVHESSEDLPADSHGRLEAQRDNRGRHGGSFGEEKGSPLRTYILLPPLDKFTPGDWLSKHIRDAS